LSVRITKWMSIFRSETLQLAKNCSWHSTILHFGVKKFWNIIFFSYQDQKTCVHGEIAAGSPQFYEILLQISIMYDSRFCNIQSFYMSFWMIKYDIIISEFWFLMYFMYKFKYFKGEFGNKLNTNTPTLTFYV
jgi:hypothetical protein